jgi:hypothetical protein
MIKPILIGFCGKAGSGKSYLSDKTIEKLKDKYPNLKICKISLAEDVKRIARNEFGWDGKKDSRGRKLLVGIGNDVGRRYNDLIWVGKFLKKITSPDFDFDVVFTDDVRYSNEADFFDFRCFIKKPFLKRIRDFFKPMYWNASERSKISYVWGDYKLINNYDKKAEDDVFKAIDEFLIEGLFDEV